MTKSRPPTRLGSPRGAGLLRAALRWRVRPTRTALCRGRLGDVARQPTVLAQVADSARLSPGGAVAARQRQAAGMKTKPGRMRTRRGARIARFQAPSAAPARRRLPRNIAGTPLACRRTSRICRPYSQPFCATKVTVSPQQCVERKDCEPRHGISGCQSFRAERPLRAVGDKSWPVSAQRSARQLTFN